MLGGEGERRLWRRSGAGGSAGAGGAQPAAEGSLATSGGTQPEPGGGSDTSGGDSAEAGGAQPPPRGDAQREPAASRARVGWRNCRRGGFGAAGCSHGAGRSGSRSSKECVELNTEKCVVFG